MRVCASEVRQEVRQAIGWGKVRWKKPFVHTITLLVLAGKEYEMTADSPFSTETQGHPSNDVVFLRTNSSHNSLRTIQTKVLHHKVSLAASHQTLASDV